MANPYDSDAGRETSMATSREFMTRIERLGMSPRQQVLNSLFARYRCLSYEARRCDWDGREVLDPVAHEAIASAGFIPPGYYDAGGESLPLKFRRPSAPYYLTKAITDRFTGLLFSERRHPKIHVDGDPVTDDYVGALAEASRLWPTMIRARALGGAMGTVVVGFQFINGRPRVDVHDPRWVFPVFEDRESLTLKSAEIRYMTPKDEKNPETGRWETVWYWVRRIIDESRDVVFEEAHVGKGEEPDWQVEKSVDHGLGFCPLVWVQNLPVDGDIDGDPDCHGIYDTVEQIDALIAQANRGIIANVDPTLVIVSEAKLQDVAKGSDNAIKLPPQSSAAYLELTGAAAKAAMDQVDKLRAQALEVAQCVLEHPDVTTKTATEVERRYESMMAKADVLREQYGEHCVKPLLRMMIRAATTLGQPRVVDGGIVRQALVLPPKVTAQGSTPRKLGKTENPEIQLAWPPYFEPTHMDALQAAQATTVARAAKLIDEQHAVNYVAPYFRVEDPSAMLEALKKEKADDSAGLDAAMSAGMPGIKMPSPRSAMGGSRGGDDPEGGAGAQD